MPEMDGYQVLETILAENLPTLCIVISGDIQPESYQRVTSLGALGFIQKPINKNILTEVLSSHGVFCINSMSNNQLVQCKQGNRTIFSPSSQLNLLQPLHLSLKCQK